MKIKNLRILFLFYFLNFFLQVPKFDPNFSYSSIIWYFLAKLKIKLLHKVNSYLINQV
jgi:hypothetical protein